MQCCTKWCTVNRPRSIPPGQMPPVFATRSIAPWIKRPAPALSNAASCQTILPVSGRESMYSVYYVVIVTGIGAIFLREKYTHKEQHMVRK